MSRVWALVGLVGLVVAALMLAACGGGRGPENVVSESNAPFVPVLESTDLAVGGSRIVISLLDRAQQPQFAPDTTFRARIFEPTEGGIRFRGEAELTPVAIDGAPDLRDETLYIVRDAQLDQPGRWAIAVTAVFADGRSESSPRLEFDVAPDARAPDTGDPAPDVPTPTLDDAPIDQLSGDPDPLEPLYGRSVDQLLAAGEPFLIVFASSDRCAARPTCRRAVEQLKTLADETDTALVHAEPFNRLREPHLQAVIDRMNEAWTIEAEPQFYVVDGAGGIAARFQIVAELDDLRQALP